MTVVSVLVLVMRSVLNSLQFRFDPRYVKATQSAPFMLHSRAHVVAFCTAVCTRKLSSVRFSAPAGGAKFSSGPAAQSSTLFISLVVVVALAAAAAAAAAEVAAVVAVVGVFVVENRIRVIRVVVSSLPIRQLSPVQPLRHEHPIPTVLP